MNPRLAGIVSLAFLLFGYLSYRKGDIATGGVFVVIGIIFAVSWYSKKKKL